jgi:hypothetical protein
MRSLVAAFHLSPESAFWTATPEPLPVERGDSEIMIEGPKWRVKGCKSDGSISIEVLRNEIGAEPSLEPFSWLDYVRNIAHQKAMRPRNDAAKYGRRIYRSDKPFCVDS